jgi:flagellar motor switch protein FliG
VGFKFGKMKKKDNAEISKKINGLKMREVAELLKEELPSCGFALIVFDLNSDDNAANYISNVKDEFMEKALAVQLNALRNNKTYPTQE